LFKAEVTHKGEKNYAKVVTHAGGDFGPLAGAAVRAQAVLLTPVDTGNLRGSITWRTVDADGGFNAAPGGNNRTGTGISVPVDKYSVHVGTNVEYAQHVEYGTKRMSPQSFLRPAIDSMRKKRADMLAKLIRDGADRGRP